jgi:hypothetical protein
MSDKTTRPARAFLAPVILFDHMGQTATLVLPDGHRFIGLRRGDAPTLLPLDEPGEYEADVRSVFGDGCGLPLVIVTVDLAHVPTWMDLPVEAVDKIVNRTSAEVAKRRRGDAPPREPLRWPRKR